MDFRSYTLTFELESDTQKTSVYDAGMASSIMELKKSSNFCNFVCSRASGVIVIMWVSIQYDSWVLEALSLVSVLSLLHNALGGLDFF